MSFLAQKIRSTHLFTGRQSGNEGVFSFLKRGRLFSGTTGFFCKKNPTSECLFLEIPFSSRRSARITVREFRLDSTFGRNSAPTKSSRLHRLTFVGLVAGRIQNHPAIPTITMPSVVSTMIGAGVSTASSSHCTPEPQNALQAILSHFASSSRH